MPSRKPIISFGGGKGGVGKSFLAANTAVFMASKGLKTALVDADFGGANLHTVLGLDLPKTTILDFMEHKTELPHMFTATQYPNLWLAAGTVRDLAPQSLKLPQKSRLIKALHSFEFDAVIIDLGAGTSANVVDLFASSDLGILVTLPEPTAIENCYRFLKAAFFRLLRSSEKNAEVKTLIDSALCGNSAPRGPLELIDTISTISPESGRRYMDELTSFRPGLIVNQARTIEDRALSQSIALVLKRFYGFKSRPLGEIAYEDSVWLSVRNRNPLITVAPDTQAARDTMTVCNAIMELVFEFRTVMR